MIHTPSPTLHREIGRYLAFVEEARKDPPVVDTPTYEAACTRADSIQAKNPESPGPGRYEGCDDRILGEILDALTSDQSYVDEDVSNGDGFWIGRIGRFVAEQDEQGFFSYIDHMTEKNAHEAFAVWTAQFDRGDDEGDLDV